MVVFNYVGHDCVMVSVHKTSTFGFLASGTPPPLLLSTLDF